MFGTLHYDADSNDTRYVERLDGISDLGGNIPLRSACDSCRAKKVSSTGDCYFPD